MNVLKSDNIVAIERMWGFEDTHYGAITLRLEKGIRAMFKVRVDYNQNWKLTIPISLVHQNQKTHPKN